MGKVKGERAKEKLGLQRVPKGFFLKNPIIICQLSIAPIILIGNSLGNALTMSFAMLMITVPTLVVISLLRFKIGSKLTMISCFLISSLIYIPTSYIIKKNFNNSFEALGIYLPMVIINSIIIVRSRKFANKNRVIWVFLDSLLYVIVFSIEICLVSIIREILGQGSVLGHKLEIITVKMPAMILPGVGFILIGFIGAIIQKIYNNK